MLPEEHRQIKAYASLQGKTISEYILEAVRKRLHQEAEDGELSGLTVQLDHDEVLRKLWNNEKDASYDKL